MCNTNLLHPNSGGADAISAKTQVNAQQAIAWSGLNTKLPSGLQMTNHLSKATTARDHRLTIPGMRQKIKIQSIILELRLNQLIIPKQIQINLTTKCCHKTLNLAHMWSKDEISVCKGAAGSEGAHTGHKKVRHSQVHQDVVEVGPQLLVLDGACHCKQIDGSARNKNKECECCHCIEGARVP